jgi:predicted MFS family arabinose efflux permease
MMNLTAAETRVPRPRLLTRPLVLAFASGFGALTSFYLLLSVMPGYAASAGAGGAAAGLANGALLLATIAAELVTPRLVARCGSRPVLAAGLVLLGAPALALTGPATTPVILAACAVRGLGFGITVTVGGALVAWLLPGERRGEGLGLFGVVAGVPAIVALPLGLWLAGHVGYAPVFAAGAAAALAGLAAVPGLPGRGPRPERSTGILAGLRAPSLAWPALAFAVTAMAAGAVVTFVPLAVTSASGDLVTLALFAQASAATLTRWWAGRYGDRHSPSGLLAPGALAAAAGILALAFTASPAAVVAGAVLFGAGFGIMQNASLALMLGRVRKPDYDTVSAVWNFAYDAGLGLGAAGFGVVAARTGYPVAFACTAALALAALVPILADRILAARADR